MYNDIDKTNRCIAYSMILNTNAKDARALENKMLGIG